MAKDYKWFEVWYDTTTGLPPFPLLVMSTIEPAPWSSEIVGYKAIEPSSTSFDVFEQPDRKAIFSAATYQEVCLFLEEDECTRVLGRMDADGEKLLPTGRFVGADHAEN